MPRHNHAPHTIPSPQAGMAICSLFLITGFVLLLLTAMRLAGAKDTIARHAGGHECGGDQWVRTRTWCVCGGAPKPCSLCTSPACPCSKRARNNPS